MLALGLAASVAFLGDASAHRDGVGVWGPSRGPEGGWVTTVAVAPSETVYAGTYFGRLFKSVDAARTWHAVDSWVDSQIIALAIDPHDPDVVYAAALAGFFKSTDAGGSWRLVTADMRYPQTLAVDPQTPATMYAGTFDGGVLKTTNGGASWVPTNTGLTDRDVLALAIDPATPSTIYAGTGGHSASGFGDVFRSTNGGRSWAVLRTNRDGGSRNTLAIAVDPQTTSTVYIGFPGGVYKSTDRGDTWRPANAGMAAENVLLAAGARRLEVVDAEARDDGRQVRLRRVDLRPLGFRPVDAEEGLLDDVLGLADAADHPVGDREQQRPQLFVRRLRSHVP